MIDQSIQQATETTPSEKSKINFKQASTKGASGSAVAIRAMALPKFRIGPSYEDDKTWVPLLSDPKVIAKRPKGERPHPNSYACSTEGGAVRETERRCALISRGLNPNMAEEARPAVAVEVMPTVAPILEVAAEELPKLETKTPALPKVVHPYVNKECVKGFWRCVWTEEGKDLLRDYYPTEGLKVRERLNADVSDDSITAQATKLGITNATTVRSSQNPYMGWRFFHVCNIRNIVEQSGIEHALKYGVSINKTPEDVIKLVLGVWRLNVVGHEMRKKLSRLSYENLYIVWSLWSDKKDAQTIYNVLKHIHCVSMGKISCKLINEVCAELDAYTRDKT